MEQVSAGVALLSAIIAIVVAGLGVLERKRAFEVQKDELERQAEQWKQNFETQRGELERQAVQWKQSFEAELRREQASLMKDFLLEQYRYRMASYASVLKTLRLSDVDFASQGFRLQQSDLSRLTTIADEIHDHLYGEAGLLMTMPTRNILHRARKECLAILEGSQGPDAELALIELFYLARRHVRADLDLIDNRSPERLKDHVKKLEVESKVDPGASLSGAQKRSL